MQPHIVYPFFTTVGGFLSHFLLILGSLHFDVSTDISINDVAINIAKCQEEDTAPLLVKDD